uniref:Pentacotripeptide-repeat region of PRORP domain-containing protein n=1 Tax=Leersia perrieri TaxID=77586 RepID=A0A0D9XPU1_9ORYZ
MVRRVADTGALVGCIRRSKGVGAIQGWGRKGICGGAPKDARHVFDGLLRRGRGASIDELNRALAAVARNRPAAAVSCFNRMARAAGADDEVMIPPPTLPTYDILIGCCCRAGRLDLGFAAFGSVIKKGFRVDVDIFNCLLKGLRAEKRTSDAMDLVLRRMTEHGCIPNVFSYSIFLKLLCDGNRMQEALDLLHMMADDGGCPPNLLCLF